LLVSLLDEATFDRHDFLKARALPDETDEKPGKPPISYGPVLEPLPAAFAPSADLSQPAAANQVTVLRRKP
jgi:hypothetical protein